MTIVSLFRTRDAACTYAAERGSRQRWTVFVQPLGLDFWTVTCLVPTP